MLIGGVAFETPATVTVARDVPENMIFELYPNKQAMRQPRYLHKTRFLLYFDDSVAGLEAGSNVEFRGIKLGEVLDIDLTFDAATNEIRTPVVIEIEPERFGLGGAGDEGVALDRLKGMVADGFRAELTTSSLLTGQKTVNFDFFEFEEPAKIRMGEIYPVLPTASTGFGQIADRVSRILGKIDQVPIEAIGTNLEEALSGFSEMLGEVKQLAGAANEDLLPSLSTSLKKLEEMLASAEAMIAPESAVAQDIESLISDLSEAAHSIRMLAERLEEHPEELLRGKSE
jgi:paraquat-inducible protein B